MPRKRRLGLFQQGRRVDPLAALYSIVAQEGAYIAPKYALIDSGVGAGRVRRGLQLYAHFASLHLDDPSEAVRFHAEVPS